MKSKSDLSSSLYLTSALMSTRCDGWWQPPPPNSFICYRRMLTRGVMAARGPCRPAALSPPGGRPAPPPFLTRWLITHTAADVLCWTRPITSIKAGQLSADTESTLCRGNTGHCPPRRPARWGDMRLDCVRLFWQPRLGFRKPHVCLISYFISLPG